MRADIWECSVQPHYQMVAFIRRTAICSSNIRFSQEAKCKSFRLNVRLCACGITLLEARSAFSASQSVPHRFFCFSIWLTSSSIFHHFFSSFFFFLMVRKEKNTRGIYLVVCLWVVVFFQKGWLRSRLSSKNKCFFCNRCSARKSGFIYLICDSFSLQVVQSTCDARRNVSQIRWIYRPSGEEPVANRCKGER